MVYKRGWIYLVSLLERLIHFIMAKCLYLQGQNVGWPTQLLISNQILVQLKFAEGRTMQMNQNLSCK